MTLPGWEHTRPFGARSVTRYCATTRRQSARGKGWMPRRIFARLQLDGELFLLTSPFIEPQGGHFRLGPRTILKSPPIVNGPAHKNLLSGAFGEHRLRGSREA